MNDFNYISFLWNIAESLRGTYKSEDYGKVMLPMIVLRRFDCLLDEFDRNLIKNTFEDTDYVSGTEKDELVMVMLQEEHNMKDLKFFNISDYNFSKLLDDSDNIIENFNNYINGFSDNVKSIINYFNFNKEVEHLNRKNKLYSVIQKFSEVDFHINKVSNEKMGNIYEELIRRFYENTDAGEHYTPREIVNLCMECLFYTKEEFIEEQGKVISIADFCVGTGGMLSEAKNYIEKRNKNAIVELYGQELMDESFAICQADMIMKGENPENIRLGNTLSQDRFRNDQFRFLISNPPYGVTWKDESKVIKEEAELGFDGRFGAGTPRVSDGSLLFLQNMLNKMKTDEDGSRVAIILNGSPLFTGDAGSGESNVRKWVIENDLLEGIIALPTDMFYNTGISTYIWVLTNKKINKRKGKIQLLDASNFFEPMRKSLGSKRKRISKNQIKEIKSIYEKFEESEFSKIFDNEDFGFIKIAVESIKSIESLKKDERFDKLAKKDEILSKLEGFENNSTPFASRKEFIKSINLKLKKSEENILIEKDSEKIPLKEDISTYFKREVLPHLPSAWIDFNSQKTGYDIPFTRHFYKYEKLRPFIDIMEEIKSLEKEIEMDIKEVLE